TEPDADAGTELPDRVEVDPGERVAHREGDHPIRGAEDDRCGVRGGQAGEAEEVFVEARGCLAIAHLERHEVGRGRGARGGGFGNRHVNMLTLVTLCVKLLT